MKVRQDFVTNSSSSSYMLAYKPNYEGGNEALQKALEKMMYIVLSAGDEWGDTSAGEFFCHKTDFDDFLKEEYGWAGDTIEEIVDCEFSSTLYQECMDALEAGGCIITKKIGYGDGALYQILNSLVEADIGLTVLDKG